MGLPTHQQASTSLRSSRSPEHAALGPSPAHHSGWHQPQEHPRSCSQLSWHPASLIRGCNHAQGWPCSHLGRSQLHYLCIPTVVHPATAGWQGTLFTDACPTPAPHTGHYAPVTLTTQFSVPHKTLHQCTCPPGSPLDSEQHSIGRGSIFFRKVIQFLLYNSILLYDWLMTTHG